MGLQKIMEELDSIYNIEQWYITFSENKMQKDEQTIREKNEQIVQQEEEIRKLKRTVEEKENKIKGYIAFTKHFQEYVENWKTEMKQQLEITEDDEEDEDNQSENNYFLRELNYIKTTEHEFRNELQKENENLKARISKIKDENEELEETITNLEEEINKYEIHIMYVNQRFYENDNQQKETIETQAKEIKQLKNTTEYQINAKEIEEQDLQKHKELYNEMCRIHDEKKQLNKWNKKKKINSK